MSTDWQYGQAIEYKMRRRQEANDAAVNYFFNFNHTNAFYEEWDSNNDLGQAVHVEERLYIFGAPFVLPDKFTDAERRLSKTVMSLWGQFIREQK